MAGLLDLARTGLNTWPPTAWPCGPASPTTAPPAGGDHADSGLPGRQPDDVHGRLRLHVRQGHARLRLPVRELPRADERPARHLPRDVRHAGPSVRHQPGLQVLTTYQNLYRR
ncbi:MAG: hypothetical protein MZV64_63405 [Ignavibacteriales bacterium]|nr:hypothetical protein [Ignavibacteriales bacterium]